MEKNEVEPPRDGTYTELCRYIMQAAPADYPGLEFIASLYTYSISNSGLTLRQRKALDPHCRLFLGHGAYTED